ncbi:MAG: PspC domain-containing protein [Bacteroidaceae bacterium]|nr:PspC domain-containing protein [Bacteroidaceae bacterium]
MKRIERIQISNRSFFFEEDACHLLGNFIEQIRRLYKDDGGDERVAEVENRIAEMCYDKVGADGIITAVMINEVLSVIGIKIETPYVADDADTDGAGCDTESEQDAAWYKAMLKGRKLFRDKHNNILGGVLSGIAMYYGVDVSALRVIAILLFVLPVTLPLVLIYVILWIFLPKATTIMDYTRMRRIAECGDKEAVKRAWKRNYEQCVEELSIPADKGCLYSLVRVLFFILVAIMIMPLGVVVFALLFAFLSLLFVGWGAFEFLNLPFMVMMGVVLVVAIPIFLLIYSVLARMGVCGAMKKNTKRFFVALWVVVLLIVTPMAHSYIKDNGGYENIDETLEYQWNNLKSIFSGDWDDVVFMNGCFTSTSGNFYGTRRVVNDKDALVAAVWDAGAGNLYLPLVVESVYDCDGVNTVAFYAKGDCFSDTQEKVLDGVCDARISVTFLPGDEVWGWHCFMWDSINNTLYYDICKYASSACASCRTEELTSLVRLCAAESFGDSVTFENANDKGLVPFKISYNGNYRTPRLVVLDADGGELEIEPVSKTIRLKGRYWNKYYKKGYPHIININQDAVDCIDDHINGIDEHINGIVDAGKDIIDISTVVVDTFDAGF